MQTRNIAGQVIETVARGLAGRIQIDAIEALHDIDVIRYLKIKSAFLTELLDFDVL